MSKFEIYGYIVVDNGNNSEYHGVVKLNTMTGVYKFIDIPNNSGHKPALVSNYGMPLIGKSVLDLQEEHASYISSHVKRWTDEEFEAMLEADENMIFDPYTHLFLTDGACFVIQKKETATAKLHFPDDVILALRKIATTKNQQQPATTSRIFITSTYTYPSPSSYSPTRQYCNYGSDGAR